MRRRLLAGVVVALTGLGPGAATRAAEADDAHIALARSVVKDLAQSLKGELMAALKAGGPLSAIAVCKSVAPALADEASKGHGMRLGRTALKVRNPANAPDDFERRVLEEFLAKTEAGADPAGLEHTEWVDRDGTLELRYMKAIPMTAEPCLACHGPSIDPALKAEIDRLYPTDQATGFKSGGLRGAFTVLVKTK